MTFSKNMITGPTVTDINETLEMLKKEISVFNIYIVLTDTANNNLMEIIKATQIFKKCYAHKEIKVIAIANGRREALQLVTDIVLENLDAADNAEVFKKRF